jgi:hypothetical protein
LATNGKNRGAWAYCTNAAHRQRGTKARQGQHILAEHSGHAVIRKEPQLVADEICRVLDYATHKEPVAP